VLEEDLVIGNEEDENYRFFRAIDIDVDSDGIIYVLDAGNYRVQKFDRKGKYLQTIGRRGQGPGEFEKPDDIDVDSNGSLYVKDYMKVHVFNNDGIYQEMFNLNSPLYPFCILENAIVGKKMMPDLHSLVIIDKKESVIKIIKEFPAHHVNLGRSHYCPPNMPELYFSKIDDKSIICGYSSNYELEIIDSRGKSVLKILKEAENQPYTKKEKEKILDNSYILNIAKISKKKLEKMIKWPKHKPFFDDIFTDDIGNNYVMKLKSRMSEDEGVEFDFFNKDGYYLYRIKIHWSLKPWASLIREGYFYENIRNQETGYQSIRRYKIKNWDQLREYRPE
jgi:hypothetical protein